MNHQDGLYLDDVWVCSPDGIATTLQSNDLTKPTTLQASHTNSFQLPDSLAIRTLTANAEQLDSASPDPYRTHRARLVQNGETVFMGVGELSSFEGGWEVALYQEKRNLFDRLDRSIRTADLSAYDHSWSIETINGLADARAGVCYPLVDNGLLQKDLLPLDAMTPAVFMHTLVGELLQQEGYSLTGNLPDDEVFKRLVIPFVEDEPTSHDETWREDRLAIVSLQRPDESVQKGALDSKGFIDRIQPFSLDNDAEQGLSQGRLHNYNTGSYSYVCDQAMRVRVQATQTFKASNITGSVEVLLIVERNGQNMGQEQWSSGTGYNILNLRTETINLDELVPCQKGDQLRIRLIARRQTALGAFSFTIYNNPDNCRVSFTPDTSTQLDDTWSVSRNLPDITGLSLFKGLAYVFGGTWVVDPIRRQVSFSALSHIVANTANAVDWSTRVDAAQEPGWVPRLDPYAQLNYLTWKEIEETKNQLVSVAGTNTSVPYGDGIIAINANVLDADATLFEMPFAASTSSEQSLTGYGNPVLIKTRELSGTGTGVTVSKQKTMPRLLLVSFGEARTVNSKKFAPDGLTSTDVTVNLRPCWFGLRPTGAMQQDERFCLAFSPVPGGRGEQCLIDRSYAGLQRVLRRMRVLTISMRLFPEDIAGLDFERPIRLRRLQVGSLTITDGFYYLNKIPDYVDGRTCRVTLIAF
ncbi:hypothetical protein [Spirosoma fluminis]